MPPRTKRKVKRKKRAARTAPAPERVNQDTGEITQVAVTGIRDRATQGKIRALADSINKKMRGRGRVYMANEVTPSFKLRRPFGLLGLDVAIAGGAPAGGMTEIIAKDGVGKTTLANYAVAENQRIYGGRSAAFVASIEGQWDKEHARNQGVRIAFSEQELKEMEEASGVEFDAVTRKAMLEDQVGEIYEPRAVTAEALLQEVIELARSNFFQLGIIDSIGALLPEAMDEGSMENKYYGGNAMILTQFCNKWFGLGGLKGEDGHFNQTSVILINQYRMVIGGPPHSNPMKIQGGHALKHAKMVDIDLKSTGGDRIEDESKHKLGKRVRWTILKGKAGHHEGATGEYDYYFDTHQVDWAKEAFGAGVQSGVIERRGSAYYSWEGHQFHGEKSATEALSEPETRARLKKQIFEKRGIQCLVGK